VFPVPPPPPTTALVVGGQFINCVFRLSIPERPTFDRLLDTVDDDDDDADDIDTVPALIL
jgi:hypothetical protein